jgi:hypothetical protein
LAAKIAVPAASWLLHEPAAPLDCQHETARFS